MSTTAERHDHHEQRLAAAFVQLVDTIVDEFDVIELLTILAQQCVALLDAAEAGILLADGDGQLRVVAASSDQVTLLELFQLQNNEGPCRDCYTQQAVIIASDLASSSAWPLFGAVSIAAGFPSVCALPLRHKQQIFGSLNLFMTTTAGLGAAEIALAQALADVASISIVQDAATRQATVREDELQHTPLNSRVAIEQAKGIVSERARVDMDEAFARLRAFARNTNRGLTEVATSLVAGSRDIDAIVASRRPPPRPKRAAAHHDEPTHTHAD